MPEPAAAADLRPQRRPLKATDAVLLLAGAAFILLLLLPISALLLHCSVDSISTHLNDPQTIRLIGLSLGTSLLSTLLLALTTTPLAYVLARRRFPGRRILEIFCELPLVLPPAVAGIALLLAFGRTSFIGGIMHNAGIEVAFSTSAVVLAQMFVSAPFFINAAIIGFTFQDADLEEAAATDGAGRWETFAWVTAPLAGRALLGGATMATARALGEFGATIIFAGNFPGRTQTLPLAIYLGFESGDMDRAVTLSVLLLACSIVVLILARTVVPKNPAK
jgi:molybdate transport system permease protein